MAPPTPISVRKVRYAAVWLLAVLAPGLMFASDAPKPGKPGDPYLSFPLDKLGFDPVQPRLLVGPATYYSLNFVDNSHVLLTFNSHGLIPRVVDGTSQEEDRLITALLIEIPSGEVLARTTWHTRDKAQYLWPLAHGLFLVRIRSRLTVIDPIRNLPKGDAFHEQTFLELDKPIGYISVSPGGDLLVVEAINPPHPDTDADSNLGTPQVLHFNTEPTAEIRFFRTLFQAGPGEQPHLVVQAAGLASARSLIRVPATAEGFLDILKESNQTWLFDFQSHAGKRLELSPFDTTCAPSPYFVSRTEFVAIGCRGSDTRLLFSGFNLRGEQPWIQVLSGQQISPIIVTAPDAGRFAFSRILVSGSFYDIQNLVPEELSGQEIQVIQHHDGRILLKVQATPIQRTGQNFDLSPDGLSFTVIRNGNLEVYHLPELTPKDQDQVKLAATVPVDKNDARIRLIPVRPNMPAKPTPSTPAEQVLTINAPSAIPTPAANAGDVTNAQPGDDGPRTPPSLYGPDYPKNPK